MMSCDFFLLSSRRDLLLLFFTQGLNSFKREKGNRMLKEQA